jgi:hypothetical protein
VPCVRALLVQDTEVIGKGNAPVHVAHQNAVEPKPDWAARERPPKIRKTSSASMKRFATIHSST